MALTAARSAAPPRGESLVPSPRMVWRLRTYFLTRYRRTWRASVVSAFLQPFLYLLAMGVLLGDYVDASAGASARLGGESYLHYVAPGLLCAAAMQFSAAESLWPVLGALKWDRTYHSMVATPISVAEIAAGAIADVTARTALSVTVFVAVLVPFGIFDDTGAVVATLLVGVLTGATSTSLFLAYSVRVHSESNFGLMFRLGIFRCSCSPARSSRSPTCPTRSSGSPRSPRCGTPCRPRAASPSAPATSPTRCCGATCSCWSCCWSSATCSR
jgi:lipooligosaccharide transport system permease protein